MFLSSRTSIRDGVTGIVTFYEFIGPWGQKMLFVDGHKLKSATYFLQNSGTSRMITVKISSRPRSMHQSRSHLPRYGIAA